ncbi:hypothetical protein HDK90DRAFT_462365 [Phyllosticta capitalensis]|uniref:Uncharacterized protein n=1 Tax=Phyllosticta capitalensis TaxID=121624 RepID=A0ABR1YXK1_9PEZI
MTHPVGRIWVALQQFPPPCSCPQCGLHHLHFTLLTAKRTDKAAATTTPKPLPTQNQNNQKEKARRRAQTLPTPGLALTTIPRSKRTSAETSGKSRHRSRRSYMGTATAAAATGTAEAARKFHRRPQRKAGGSPSLAHYPSSRTYIGTLFPKPKVRKRRTTGITKGEERKGGTTVRDRGTTRYEDIAMEKAAETADYGGR